MVPALLVKTTFLAMAGLQQVVQVVQAAPEQAAAVLVQVRAGQVDRADLSWSGRWLNLPSPGYKME